MHEPNECPDVLAARAAAKVAAEAAVRAAQEQAARAAEEERMGQVVMVHGCAEGLGLGLAICFEVVQQFGGRLDIRSAPGDGTEVAVILPLLARDDTQEAAE